MSTSSAISTAVNSAYWEGWSKKELDDVIVDMVLCLRLPLPHREESQKEVPVFHSR